MQLFSYAEIMIFCISILLSLLFAVRRGMNRLTNQTIYSSVLVLAALAMLFCLLCRLNSCGILGKSVVMNLVFNEGFFIASVALSFQWLRYVGYKMGLSFWRKPRSLLLVSLPMVFVVMLSVLSPWTDWFLHVESGLFSGTPINIVFIACCCLYVVAAVALAASRVFKRRYYAERSVYLSLASFGVFPLIGILIETIFAEVPATALAVTLSVMLAFFEMQSRLISTDPLTKLNNRNQLNVFLLSKVGARNTSKALYLFVLDIDMFKGINDNFGHIEGDRALNVFATTLRRVCGPRGCFISRFGGDEFNLVAELDNDACAEEICTAINNELKQQSAALPYELCASIGYAKCVGPLENIGDLFCRADRRLYRIKKIRRERVI